MIRFRPLVLLLLVRRPRGRWTIQMNRHIVRSPRLPKRCQCRPRLNEHCMIIKRSRHPPKRAAHCTTATHHCTPLTSPCSNHKHNHSLNNPSLPTARFILPPNPPPSHSAKETVDCCDCQSIRPQNAIRCPNHCLMCRTQWQYQYRIIPVTLQWGINANI